MVTWFCLENFVWEKYLRYIFTIYPVFIFAFSGLVEALKLAGSGKNLMLALANLGIACFLFLVRITLSIYRICFRKLAVVEPKSDTEKCGLDEENENTSAHEIKKSHDDDGKKISENFLPKIVFSENPEKVKTLSVSSARIN